MIPLGSHYRYRNYKPQRDLRRGYAACTSTFSTVCNISPRYGNEQCPAIFSLLFWQKLPFSCRWMMIYNNGSYSKRAKREECPKKGVRIGSHAQDENP
jgi:hypothetical protein